VLLAVINYIKTPQQYPLFKKFQRLAYNDLPTNVPAEQRKILEPIKPVVMRWNTFCSCFERAVELQLAVNGYANHHIQRIETEDAYARSHNNKLPVAPNWIRSDGINAFDWQVITEYIDVLKPLKAATKRLEGRGKSGAFGVVAEIIPVFEYLLGVYEDRLQSYDDVIHDEHDESPGDYLAINLRAALLKAHDYYNKLDLSPGSSCECERLFSELGDLLEPRRRNISPELLAAIQCNRQWIRTGFGSSEVPVKDSITDKEIDAKYGVHKWVIG
jgi:hypothetical protein